jgi:hypothetical protein
MMMGAQMAPFLAYNQFSLFVRKNGLQVDCAQVEGFARTLSLSHIRVGNFEPDFARTRLKGRKWENLQGVMGKCPSFHPAYKYKYTLMPSSQSW